MDACTPSGMLQGIVGADLLLMVMSPCMPSSRWLNLTTGSLALLKTWTLCTPGTHFRRTVATRSNTSAGEAVDRSMSERMESSERLSSKGHSAVCPGEDSNNMET